MDEIHVYDNIIRPCTACGICRDKFLCPIDDDMKRIYPLIQQADVISISTPLYFSSIPSPLKALIDRCQVFWERNKSAGAVLNPRKQGVLICTAGSDYSNMFSGVLLAISHLFNTLGVCFNSEDALLLPGLDSEPGKQISIEKIDTAVKLSDRIITGINR